MDNGLAFIGSASSKRSLSKTVKSLFQKQVIPIFTNPRSPWNNGSVEGSNSVFARNFWNKHIRINYRPSFMQLRVDCGNLLFRQNII